MKIALIGAGSYVFGPSILSQALREWKLNDIELALMDVDEGLVTAVADVGQRIASEQGLTNSRVTAHTTRETALTDADFVICSASPQMQRRFRIDKEIIAQHYPEHVVSEFGGLSGLLYSLRQIAFFEPLCADIRQFCPNAYLFNVANPLPRVMQAAHLLGVKAVGLCSFALVAHDMVSQLLFGESDRFPFQKTRDRLKITTAGLNHHAFVLELRDKATGADLLPQLRQVVCKQGKTGGNPRAERLLCETGYLLAPTDDHTRDFFAPAPGDIVPHTADTWHGSETQRADRLQDLHDYAAGHGGDAGIFRVVAWERPIDIIASLRLGHTACFDAMNLPNTGQIPELPMGIYVETPAEVSEAGIVPTVFSLPQATIPYCLETAHITDTIVHAALERDRKLLDKVVVLDPTIVDKAAGERTLTALLAAHADMLPLYQ